MNAEKNYEGRMSLVFWKCRATFLLDKVVGLKNFEVARLLVSVSWLVGSANAEALSTRSFIA